MTRFQLRNCLLLLLSLLLMIGGTGLFFALTPTPAMAQQADPSASPAVEEAEPKPINDVPPKPSGLNIYINDYANLLTPEHRSALRETLQALDEAGIAQISVLVLPNTDRELSDFAPEIMNQWDIQHYKKKDGLLVLVNAYRLRHNLSGNRIFIGTGYMLEEKLPDALVGRILDEQAIPAFNAGEYSAGVTRATLTIAKVLAGDQKLTAHYSQPTQDEDSVWGAILIIGFVLLMFFGRRGRGRGGFYGGGFGGYTGGGFGGGGFGGGFGGGGDSGGGGGAGR